MNAPNPEIGKSIAAAGFLTNYHDLGVEKVGDGGTALLIHGSGPGVSAWAKLAPGAAVLARQMRVIAPDMVGFGFSERPPASATTWIPG